MTLTLLEAFMRTAETMRTVGLGLVALLIATGTGGAEPVRIGVSDAVYADLAHQIGGPVVAISLLDRQAVVASGAPSALTGQDIVLCGGIDTRLCDAVRRASPAPVVIEAGQPATDSRPEPGWPCYDMRAMAALARDVAGELSRRVPAQAPRIAANLALVMDGFRRIDRKIDEIARTYAASDVIITAPFADLIAERLRFKIQDPTYIAGLRRGVPPSAASVAALRDAVERRKASILVYDRDALTPAINSLVALANDSGIPVVGLGETLPRGLHYQQWMLRQLNAIHGALNEASP